jgi:hypothetical protein
MALADLLTSLTTILTSIISWSGSIVTFITGNALLLVFVATGILGYAFITVKGFLHN